MKLDIGLRSLLMTAIAIVVAMPDAIAEPGLQGSYAGIPVDLSNLLKQNPALVTSPEHLANAAMQQALKSTGITPDFNATASLQTNPAVGAQFQGRYDVPNSPLSVRGSVYFGDNSRAVMPVVTYDIPVGGSTNFYAGAGVAIVNTSAGKTTPVGDRTGVVVTTGLETEINKGIVLYGDAKWLSSNKGTGTPPVRYQLGVGYRF